MLRNHLVVALRRFYRHKGHTVLHVAGLAVGMACAALVLSYVLFEASFDRFHTGADRIYRVVQQQPGNAFLGTDHFAVAPAGLGEALRTEVAEVETATAFAPRSALVEAGGQAFEEKGLAADPHFFRLFSFPLERGDPATALAAPDAVVLSASLAEKLFGAEDPVGETVRFDEDDFTVTGVAADPPEASHITFAFVRSLLAEPHYLDGLDEWASSSWQTYLALRPGVSPDVLEARLTDVLRTHRPDDDDLPRFYGEALTDIHLRSTANFGLGERTDIRLLYLFGAVAVVILLLGCVNYTNLAVARSVHRAREIGMRRVVGASRGQLAAQHLGEAVLTALVALGLGVVLAHLFLPTFAGWLERDLVLTELGGWRFYAALLGLAVAVGGLAGLYPAFAITQVQPATILKGGRAPLGRARLRSALVVGQYAAAIVLLAGTLVIYQQLRFIQDRPLGFDRDHVVALTLRGIEGDEVPAFKADLDQVPGVAGVAASTSFPTNISSSTALHAWEGRPEDAGDPLRVYQAYIDNDFLDLYGIDLVAGRGFSPDHPADTAGAVLLNETAVEHLGWTPTTALGRTIRRGEADVPVVGVVRDFHMHAMHLPVAPLLMQPASSWRNRVSVRVQPGDLRATLAGIERVWMAHTPYPFDYEFLDEAFDQLYQTDRRLGEGVAYFTLVALFVACLGLFGLAAHATEQRTKEVGIRKVLGASVASVVALLSSDFLGLVGAAFAIAVPVAYVATGRWLDTFAYHVAPGVGTFALAGGLALLVAALAVGGHAFRAATANPVDALRSE